MKVLEVGQDRRFVVDWGPDRQEKRVTIELEPDGPGAAAVTVTEGSWEADEAGIQTYGGQIYGWASFLFCLKASVEYGIDLRKGSITRRKKELIAAGPAARR